MERDIQNIKKMGIAIDVQKASHSKTGKWVTLPFFSEWLYFCQRAVGSRKIWPFLPSL